MNLLYVAMTRAKQALIVSGNAKKEVKEETKKTLSWYDRIAAVVSNTDNTLPDLQNPVECKVDALSGIESQGDAIQLPSFTPIGKRTLPVTGQQQRGIWLHALLQKLSESSDAEEAQMRQLLDIPLGEMNSLWSTAQYLLNSPQLARFFDAGQYLSAGNEIPYINLKCELKRIDRLVEFENEVWVLDYKLGDSEDAARYQGQMHEYRTAMQSMYQGKIVRAALIFANGELAEVK
jgi:ATP-dependent helicase/nuclease subunit A